MPLSFDQQVTFLYVKDLEKSARFYGETLALTLVLDQGPARIRQRADVFVRDADCEIARSCSAEVGDGER